MNLDYSKLGRGEWLAGGAGVALFVTLFLPWFGTAPEENPFIPPARQVTVNAWHTAFDLWLLLALLATVVGALAAGLLLARGIDAIRWAQLRLATAGLAALGTILILYRMVDPLENTTLRVGIVLSLIATLAVLAGTQLSMLDEGYLRRFGGGAGGGGGAGLP